MARQLHRLGVLTIPANGHDSPAFTVPVVLGPLIGLLVFTPAALLEVVTLQVSPQQNPVAADWKTLQIIPGVDAVFAAGKAVSVRATGFQAVRLHAEPQVVVDRAFEVMAQLDVTD